MAKQVTKMQNDKISSLKRSEEENREFTLEVDLAISQSWRGFNCYILIQMPATLKVANLLARLFYWKARVF